MKKIKALLLFSGGLDSILAVKILQEQRIEVQALALKSAFFNADEAKQTAKKIGVLLRIIDFSKAHFQIVKNPRFGYGKNMNPCIDCHLLMLSIAKKIMDKEGFSFVATGEVLGERPMSQNRQALELIAKQSRLKGKLLRPLSAKLLEPSEMETKGLINREKLLDIQGRSRKRQLALAKKWKIDYYPTPAGGCLLTDPEFSKKLKNSLKNSFNVNEKDVKILTIGRHFWFPKELSKKNKVKIVIGRDHKENLLLKKIRRKEDILIELKTIPGPVALIRSYSKRISIEAIKEAKNLIKKYSSKAKRQQKVEFITF